jgi:hypothetical protein
MTVIGLIVLGLVAGAFAAALGVGGGVIFVPSLVVIFSFTQHTAQGTSLAVVVPTAIVGAMVHTRAGRVDWKLALRIAVGGVIGAVTGSRTALALDGAVLRRLFAGLLVVMAGRMLLRSLRVRQRTG